MPPKSQNQAVATNLARAVQTGQATAKPGSPSAEIAASMKPSDMADFTGPVNENLPKRVQPRAPAGPPTVKRKPQMRVKNVGKPVKKFRF
jgi:hypothetical protein